MGKYSEGEPVGPEEIVRDQVHALRALAAPDGRRAYLEAVAARRGARRMAGVDPEDPDSGFPMVPLSLVEVGGRPDNHSGVVPVVADEIAVTVTDVDRSRAEDLLARAGFERAATGLVTDVTCCTNHLRYVGPPGEVDRLLLRLRAERIVARRGAAVALADTVKGPNDPKKPAGGIELVYPGAESTGEPAPVVVVIDTGLEPDTHRGDWLRAADVTALDPPADHDPVDAIDNLTGDSTRGDDRIDPAAGHGTFVAGMIRRVAPSARIVMLRAVDSEGFASDAMVAAAICRAAVHFGEDGRGVVNLSLGGETVDDLIPPVIECALRKLPEEVVVVAAAGNEPTGVPVWPAASKRVVSVAALDLHDRPADWSNFGSTVDFSVRGEGLVSTFVEGTDSDGDTFDADDYGIWSGTSFAAPQVAAKIALAMVGGASADAAVQSLRDAGTYLPGRGYVLGADKIVLQG